MCIHEGNFDGDNDNNLSNNLPFRHLEIFSLSLSLSTCGRSAAASSSAVVRRSILPQQATETPSADKTE